jgi:hypothetical protein
MTPTPPPRPRIDHYRCEVIPRIRADLAHEIRHTRAVLAIATEHAWTVTAGALRAHLQALRKAGKFYHK